MRTLATIVALWCSCASAYLGSFEPTPIRNAVTIRFIDSQLAGPSCAIEAAKAQPAYALLSPLMAQLTACAITEPPTVIAPITFGPGSIYALQLLATPDALLGHETRHIFDGQFHLPLLPFVDVSGLRHHDTNRRIPAGEQHD